MAISLQDIIGNALARPATAPRTPIPPVTSATTTDTVAAPVADSVSSVFSQSGSALRDASASFAQLGSLLEVAQTGTQQVAAILRQLNSIATQAANSTAPAKLNTEFQHIISQIELAVGNASFGGVSLFDGTFSGAGSDNVLDTALSIPDLTPAGLFGSNAPNLLSADNAQSAVSATADALGTLGNVSDSISAVQAQLSFASANVESAIANTTASSSVLTDADLAGATGGEFLAGILRSPGASAQAQTGNLSGTILSLLQE